jgi:hypothetical protein
LLTREGRAQPIRIWALLGARAGDNDQVLALAEAVGLPFETKQLEYNRLRHLGPRLLGPSFASLTARSRDALLAEPPPHLTISAGHRSVAVVRALRRRSGGRTRSVHVGFPRVSPGFFDLVIATPQYPIPDHPNLMRVPYALTRIATGDSDGSEDPELKQLPKPLGLLVVRMDLDREALAGEEIFDEQRLLTGAGEPDLSDALAGGRVEHGWKLGAAPRLFDVAPIQLHARTRRRIGSTTLAIAS